MNLIEDRIRAAARAAADTVTPDGVPPLELPVARPGRFGRRHRGARSLGVTWPAWGPRLAPWAAAAAIVALVITLVNVSPAPTYEGSSNSTGSSPAGPPGIPAGPPVSSYVQSGQLPPFYVTLTPPGAVVHLTQNGATLGTIRPSRPGATVVAASAAADDRTFVLAEQGRPHQAVMFYRVRLGSAGRPSAPTRLPMSLAAGQLVTGLALSPDGTRLAIAVEPGGDVQQIRLYAVSGGPARIWSATGGSIGGFSTARSLSWPASQRTLAFNWLVHTTRSVRLLDLGTAGGSLLAASRPAVTVADTAPKGKPQYGCQADMILTPDGSAVVCPSSGIRNTAKDGTITYSAGYPEFSAATGRVIRIVGNWPTKFDDPAALYLFWSSTSGQVLIGAIHSAGRDWFGVISGNGFTPLSARWAKGADDFGTW
jgi:hypothetical protein